MIHGQCATCEASVYEASASLQFYFKRSQLITTIGHAGGGDCIRDQRHILNSFGLHKKINHGGRHVESVGDDVGGQMIVGENLGQNAGIAMIQPSHRVKRMSSMARAGSKSVPRRFQSRVGVSEADAHSSPCCLGDHLQCALEFRGDGDHTNVAACSLPELVKGCESRYE